MVSYFPFFYLQVKKKIRQSQAKNKIIFNNYFTKDLTLTKTLLKLRVKLKTKEEKMKYVLKKDLPFAKAGTEIILHGSRLDYPNLTLEIREDNCLHVWCEAWQVHNDWIEEVKPREFYLVVDGLGDVLMGSSNPIISSDSKSVIKVREIIE